MAGIYIHIPFCKQACHYCDFHFSTQTSDRQDLIAAIALELSLQKNYLGQEPVETIYFGGGTPSLLSAAELSLILDAVRAHYQTVANAELTLEANPDDLSSNKLRELKQLGINRLSIGIQSFDDSVLKFLNRAHDADAARNCVVWARQAGFSNISIDLIYAIQGMTTDLWDSNIHQAIALQPEHISSYSLTIEEKTVFGHWMKKKVIDAVPDETAAAQLTLLVDRLENAGYDQYEISNFSLPGFESRHNSSYWRQTKYLGVGPSAHSYNESSRQFNVRNNHLYVKSMQAGKIPYEVEMLSIHDKINDYLLTTLRTRWGANLEKLKSDFNYDLLHKHGRYLEQLMSQKLARIDNQILLLTKSGKLLADKIASDLFSA
ncbi:MAG: radical SAM family heme chaperone HemW [Bacteroidota bacterium]